MASLRMAVAGVQFFGGGRCCTGLSWKLGSIARSIARSLVAPYPRSVFEGRFLSSAFVMGCTWQYVQALPFLHPDLRCTCPQRFVHWLKPTGCAMSLSGGGRGKNGLLDVELCKADWGCCSDAKLLNIGCLSSMRTHLHSGPDTSSTSFRNSYTGRPASERVIVMRRPRPQCIARRGTAQS